MSEPSVKPIKINGFYKSLKTTQESIESYKKEVADRKLNIAPMPPKTPKNKSSIV